MTGVGTIDLGTKQIAFRVEPKLVMTTEGQGRASDPVGLGIPVMIDGPWAEPRIYPDMAGILDNPDAAYAKLKEMGKGLFGKDGGGLGGLLGGLTGGGTAGSGLGTDGAAGGGLSRRQARRNPRQSDPAGPRRWGSDKRRQARVQAKARANVQARAAAFPRRAPRSRPRRRRRRRRTRPSRRPRRTARR